MKIQLEIGETEKHKLDIVINQFWGYIEIKVDGQPRLQEKIKGVWLRQNWTFSIENGKCVSIDDGNLLLDSKRLQRISKLVQDGTIRPIIDKVYPLEEIREAHRYVESWHKVGGVALTIG